MDFASELAMQEELSMEASAAFGLATTSGKRNNSINNTTATTTSAKSKRTLNFPQQNKRRSVSDAAAAGPASTFSLNNSNRSTDILDSTTTTETPPPPSRVFVSLPELEQFKVLHSFRYLKTGRSNETLNHLASFAARIFQMSSCAIVLLAQQLEEQLEHQQHPRSSVVVLASSPNVPNDVAVNEIADVIDRCCGCHPGADGDEGDNSTTDFTAKEEVLVIPDMAHDDRFDDFCCCFDGTTTTATTIAAAAYVRCVIRASIVTRVRVRVRTGIVVGAFCFWMTSPVLPPTSAKPRSGI
jgi:hypothetical protein